MRMTRGKDYQLMTRTILISGINFAFPSRSSTHILDTLPDPERVLKEVHSVCGSQQRKTG